MPFKLCYYCYRISRGHEEATLPPEKMDFEIRIETNESGIFNQLQKKLQAYRDERKGPTILVIQSVLGKLVLFSFK